jgi:toluene monooxygenase system ferredoxin subunit
MFKRVCSRDDLWEGEMQQFEVGGREILLVHLLGGQLRAIPASCPHQSQPLVDGILEGSILTCRAHWWEFDLATGKGVNPADCSLVLFPVKVEGDDVYVDVEGE